MANLKIKFGITGVRAVLSGFRRIASAARRTSRRIKRSMSSAAASINAMKGKLLLAGAALGTMVGLTARAAGKFEMLKLRLKVVTGSAEEAEKAFKEIFAFSTRTPFDPAELVEASILLKAFGQTGMDALQSVAEAAAAMDRPIADIATAVGSMETEPLRRLGIELKRAGNDASVTFRDKLGKEVTKSAEGIDNVRKLILQTFSSKFGGGLGEASKTLFGLFSTLKGNVSAAFAAVGDELLPIFKAIINAANDIVARLIENDTLKNIGKRIADGAVRFGGVVATMADSWDDFKATGGQIVKTLIAGFKVAGADIARVLKETIQDGAEVLFRYIKAALIPGRRKPKGPPGIFPDELSPEQKNARTQFEEEMSKLAEMTSDKRDEIEMALEKFATVTVGASKSIGSVLGSMSNLDDLAKKSGRTESGISLGDLHRFHPRRIDARATPAELRERGTGFGRVGSFGRLGSFKNKGRGTRGFLGNLAAGSMQRMSEQMDRAKNATDNVTFRTAPKLQLDFTRRICKATETVAETVKGER